MPYRMGKKPLVRQNSRPLTDAEKTKLREAQRLIAGEDVVKTNRAFEREEVDASSLGMRLKASQQGSGYVYSVSEIHAAFGDFISEGDVLLMVGQTHITNKSPSDVTCLCQASTDPRGVHLVFAARLALEEKINDELEFVNLSVCFADICVEAQMLWCPRRQGSPLVQLLATKSPTRSVPKVQGKYLQVDRDMCLRLVKNPKDKLHNSHIRFEVHEGKGILDENNKPTVYLRSLALHKKDGSILYFAAEKNCVGDSLPLKFQDLKGPLFETKNGEQIIRPEARCAVFLAWQKDDSLELRPLEFEDVTICVENDLLIGKTAQGDTALFDFGQGSDPNIPADDGVTPQSGDSVTPPPRKRSRSSAKSESSSDSSESSHSDSDSSH